MELLVGSEAHKALFCRTFVETGEEYEPRELPWPVLDDGALKRLRSLPIWGIALQAETNAGAMVSGFAATISDPLIRQAVALQGAEEERHGRMIATLVERYELGAFATPPSLEPTEQAFIHFGYRECLDSFIGFGAFRMARETQFMPDALIALFSRVLWEEARHIVFFVNWIAYERVRRGYGGPFFAAVAGAIGYVRALVDMIVTGRQATGGSAEPPDFSALAGVSLTRFLRAALYENDLLMARFDRRLLRPRVMPTIARCVLSAADAGRELRAKVTPRASG